MKPTVALPAFPTPPSADAEEAVPVLAAETICSHDLFGSQRELVIEHAGQLYRLRITQNNKLILTK